MSLSQTPALAVCISSGTAPDPRRLCTLVPFCVLAIIPWTWSAAGKQCRDTEKESAMSYHAVPIKLFTSSPNQPCQTWTSSMQSHLVDSAWCRETKWYQFRLCKVSELLLGQLDPGNYSHLPTALYISIQALPDQTWLCKEPAQCPCICSSANPQLVSHPQIIES